jgi:uncharacterized paraquat-inducible protein A
VDQVFKCFDLHELSKIQIIENNLETCILFIIYYVYKSRLTMMVESSSKLMQYHLFEQNTQDISITDNLDNEIECPRCHDVMTLFSDFDFLYYQCEECHLPLYTSSNQFVKL